MNSDEQLTRLGVRTVTLPGLGHNALVENPHLASALPDPHRSWSWTECAEGRLAGHELVDVAVRPPEVLPGRSWFAQQFDACPSQFVHGRRQVADGEADNRAGSEMLLARIAAAENFDVPSIRKLEDPEIRFLMHRSEAENMLVEMRQITAAACSRAAPSKTRDLHACQYHHDQGSPREPPTSASSSG